MITIIAATNRPKSETARLAHYVAERMAEWTSEVVEVVDLATIPAEALLHSAMYGAETQNPILSELQDRCMVPADKWYFVLPEYNGSFPGVLKLFIDALSIRRYKESFQGKKAALLGLAAGRAGNLRGLDHLTGVLQYLQFYVHPNRLPVSQIGKVWNEAGQLDAETAKALEAQIKAFLAF